MTLGERIQSLRKEKGISQETLGEQLGVTRQSISKWESDLTVPELDKLIALSRLFGVSIGTLLGLEEGEAAKELTDRELAALEAIAARLRPPQPAPVKRRRWPIVAAVVLCLFVAGSWISRWTENINHRIDNLYNSSANLENRLVNQINSISGQVTEALERQNLITAAEECKLYHVDVAENLVYFKIAATPRDYQEGMTATFTAQLEDGRIAAQPGEFSEETKSFSCALAAPLTNGRMILSVSFEAGGQAQTRVLEERGDLLTQLQPWVYHSSASSLWGEHLQKDGSVKWLWPDCTMHWQEGYTVEEGEERPVHPQKIVFYLWRNGELLQELGEATLDMDIQLAEWRSEEPILFRDMKKGDVVTVTVRCTDPFDRTVEYAVESFVLEDDRMEFYEHEAPIVPVG